MTEKKKRGFAAMSKEKQLACAKKGGASVASANRSFSRDPTLAERAGRTGGQRSKGGGRPSVAKL